MGGLNLYRSRHDGWFLGNQKKKNKKKKREKGLGGRGIIMEVSFFFFFFFFFFFPQYLIEPSYFLHPGFLWLHCRSQHVHTYDANSQPSGEGDPPCQVLAHEQNSCEGFYNARG